MSKPPDIKIKLNSDTLNLCGFTSGGRKGFWLYDSTQGMNLAMRASSEMEAFVDALHYYQKRLKQTEKELNKLQSKVYSFVEQFTDNELNEWPVDR